MEEWLIVDTGAQLPAVLLFFLSLLIFFFLLVLLGWARTKYMDTFFVPCLYKRHSSKKNFCHYE